MCGDYLIGKLGLGQTKQNCTLCVYIISCLYWTVQLPGISIDIAYQSQKSFETASTNHRLQNLLQTNEQSDL